MYQTARDYINAGLNPVPLPKGGKVPIRKDWGSPIGKDVENYDWDEIGICTGTVSGGLEVIDFDLDVLSEDEAEEVWLDWKSRVPVNILEKLTIAKTQSGGYHAIYRTTIVEGNKKLARKVDKTVMIETRGEGGYIKCFPSEGYEMIYGDLKKIQSLEDYERNVLIRTSTLYDRMLSKEKKYYSDEDYKDPFPDYNSDPDIGLDLLEEEGWEILKEDGEWVHLKRPGKRRHNTSATYNLESNFLYVFSVNTDFETERPYSNSAIFCILKAGGNYGLGYQKLRKLGYGADRNRVTEEELEDLSFISKRGEDEERLEQARENKVPLGLTFGWPDLDDYYVYKENTLNFVLAFEGVGKTWMMLHKLVALSVLYGKKFAICCGENEVGNTKQIIMEAISGKKISYFKDKPEEYERYKAWMYSRFFIFKNNVYYSVEDILERTKSLKKLYGISGVLIDPFSYFKKPTREVYNYNDDLLSRLNIFSKNTCTVFMTVHPNTEVTRKPRDAEGYLKPPSRYDAIGGNMFANRTDHFLVYHRIPNHKAPPMRRIMEIRCEKVKDTTTGGSVTPVHETVALTYKTWDGFTGYFDNDNRNPMYDAIKKVKKEVDKKPLPKMSPGDGVF